MLWKLSFYAKFLKSEVMKNYKELMILEKGIEFAKSAYSLVKQFPQDERYGLSGQSTEAAVSIAANIPEGSSRQSDKDYARFIQIALASSFEVQTYLLPKK
jgi:four helix bundle protein